MEGDTDGEEDSACVVTLRLSCQMCRHRRFSLCSSVLESQNTA